MSTESGLPQRPSDRPGAGGDEWRWGPASHSVAAVNLLGVAQGGMERQRALISIQWRHNADIVAISRATMSKKSAGLLLFRDVSGAVEVLLVHPGGPYWTRKDQGAWSIPKGEFSEDEDPLQAAVREFKEEVGEAVTGDFVALQPRRQAGGKMVYAWAVRSDFDPVRLRSNAFSMEWPPRSGRQQAFPEIDRAAWFSLDAARAKISKGQAGFLEELENKLERRSR